MRARCVCGALAGEKNCTCDKRMRLAALVLGALPLACAILIGVLGLAGLITSSPAPAAPTALVSKAN